MRVAIKTAEQQSALMLHKVRDLLVRQRTMLDQRAARASRRVRDRGRRRRQERAVAD